MKPLQGPTRLGDYERHLFCGKEVGLLDKHALHAIGLTLATTVIRVVFLGC